jgi:hypothetical protein
MAWLGPAQGWVGAQPVIAASHRDGSLHLAIVIAIAIGHYQSSQPAIAAKSSQPAVVATSRRRNSHPGAMDDSDSQ